MRGRLQPSRQAIPNVDRIARVVRLRITGGCGEGREIYRGRKRGLAARGFMATVIQQQVQQIRRASMSEGRKRTEPHQGRPVAIHHLPPRSHYG